MTEDKLSLEETSITESSISKHRKKRKWDQPAESLVSCGAVVSRILPMSTVGCPGVSLPGAFSSSCTPSTTSINVGYVSVQSSVVQQEAVSVVQKLNQPKIQEDLIIAREIVINDADPTMRYKLTKRQTQEEIQKCTGAVVITRGKYRPPNAVPDGEKPLYLHISAGVHLKETAERILAVDRAAAMVEDMMKQVSQPLSTCVYLGFDADPSLNIAARIRGPNDQYINHIMNETGVSIELRGRGSGYLGNTQSEDLQQPLHLLLTSNNQKSLEDAKLLAENLMDTISRECGATRVSSCKVYGAVPPPQQLLVATQSSGMEIHPISNTSASTTSTSVNLTPGVPIPSLAPPVGPPPFSYAQVVQPGPLLPPVHPSTNGLPYSQPLSAACTSYGAYAGIYPQATPLQQVAIALRQSGPVSSTTVVPKGSSESEKRAPPKRKFQEAPVAFKGSAVSLQDSNLQETCKSPPIIDKKNDPPVSLKSLLPPPPRSNSSEPSSITKSMPPPPPPSKRRVPPPPPPPLPKFDSSISVSRENNKDFTPSVPDTLVKLMEYGDDDDDDDVENGNEFLKNSANGGAPSKPFWAVK